MLDTRTTSFWKVASTFSADKEAVYPDHKIAQEFDRWGPGQTAVEYGCGGGSDGMSFLRRGVETHLTDVVADNIATAKHRIHEAGLLKNAHFHHLPNSYPLPMDDGIADVVSSHGVIHHIQNPDPVVKELIRVLKPGGTLYVMLYTKDLFDRFRPEINRLVNNGLSIGEAFGWCTDGEGCPYARYYNVTAGTELLEGNGPVKVTSTFTYNNLDFCTFRAVKA